MIHNYDKSYEYQGRIIIDCKTCGFKHVFPYFTKEEAGFGRVAIIYAIKN